MNLWVLEDQIIKYNNDPLVPPKSRYLATRGSEGYYPYHAVCCDCGRKFDQIDIAKILHIEAVHFIQAQPDGRLQVEREDAEDDPYPTDLNNTNTKRTQSKVNK